MNRAGGRIPRIPKKVKEGENSKKPAEVREYSGDLDGGTLWQLLGAVEENLVTKIFLQLGPVELINLEKTSAFVRNILVQNSVWRKKFKKDFRKMEAIGDIREKLDSLVDEVEEGYGDIDMKEHRCFKLKYIRCWNLEQNWNKGQYLYTEEELWDKDDVTLNTKYSARNGRLYCHKNNKGSSLASETFFEPFHIVDLSNTHMIVLSKTHMIVMDPDEALGVMIVDKNSLLPIAKTKCDGRRLIDAVPLNKNHTLISDDTILFVFREQQHYPFSNIVIIYIKFRLDDPKIWIEEVKIIEKAHQISSIILNGTFSLVRQDYKVEVFKIERSDSISYEKVWELDISDQNSFPRVKFGCAFINYPFVYISKSSGLLEVWDISKNKILKTLDKTDIPNASKELTPNEIFENDLEKVLCVTYNNDAILLDGKSLKGDSDNSGSGYQIQSKAFEDDGWNTNKIHIDNTCIVGQRTEDDDGFDKYYRCKLDFWPIYPGNFKLNESKSKKDEVEKKPKKRKSSLLKSKEMAAKKTNVLCEFENDERDDEYDYKDDEVYDYGVEADEDRDQFYDDDNIDDAEYY